MIKQGRLKGYFVPLVALAFSLVSVNASTKTLTLDQLQSMWDIANFELSGDEQLASFDTLLEQVDALLSRIETKQSSGSKADALIWRGIIKSSYAGITGGLGALSLAKAARKDLEEALQIDSKALAGSAQTTLGSLYANVPGWPVGFGSAKKARTFLKQGVDLDPDGLDSNCFYGVFLLDEKEYSLAQTHLMHALEAQPRPGRKVADRGRRVEIQAALARVRDKLE